MPEWIFLIFVAIREEEQKSSNVTKEIQKLVKENPAINANEIAEMLSVKAEEVRYRIKLMKKLGEITRRGATKAGECVPFAVSNYFDNFDPSMLQTILGSASILGSKDILEDFFSLKKEGNVNPYWVIWRWKQTLL